MRLVFCGTPEFAVPSLKHLLEQSDFAIAAVFTQPDRPRGRGHEVALSPVKQLAVEAGISVHQPEKIRAPESRELIEKIAPEAVVIIAYGQIIPATLLGIPRLGWINLHASLLPKYRGAAPIHWALANGETTTGVTTMRIDAGMDTGEILLQRELAIAESETAPEVAARLAELGAPLVVETLRGLASHTVLPRAQDNSAATYAPILKKEDGRIHWNLPARQIFNRMRGFTPWPGAYTEFRSQKCHIWGEPVSNVSAEPGDTEPGVLHVQNGELFVSCGDTTRMHVLSVKVEGRKQVSGAEFVRGARLQPGERFGAS